MSSVLRPFVATKKSNEEITNSAPTMIKEEVSPASTIVVEPVISVEPVKVVDEVISNESTPNSEDETKKEEKISAVLQELLDRKISKAIEGAEASLVTSQPEIIVEPSIPTPVVTEEVMPEISVPTPEPLPISEPVSVLATLPVSQEVLPILGQEIHVPAPVVEALPSTLVVEESLTVAPASTIPVVEKGNMIPINVVPQEVVAAPVIPAEAVTVATNIPVQAVVQATTTPVAAVAQPKIHWFDRLFGSTPTSPPQSA